MTRGSDQSKTTVTGVSIALTPTDLPVTVTLPLTGLVHETGTYWIKTLHTIILIAMHTHVQFLATIEYRYIYSGPVATLCKRTVLIQTTLGVGYSLNACSEYNAKLITQLPKDEIFLYPCVEDIQAQLGFVPHKPRACIILCKIGQVELNKSSSLLYTYLVQ